MGLIIKANYRLIIEPDRFGFIKSDKYSIPITGKTAIFLSLLNGGRSIEDVCEIIVATGLFSPELAPHFANHAVQRFATLLTEDQPWQDNPNRYYDPKDFVQIKAPQGERFSMPYPGSIMYVVTNNCDKACVYCYMDARQKKIEENALSYDEICALLDEAAAMGISHFALTGGEPFIRKDLTKIIVHASKLNMSVSAITKFNLSDEQLQDLTGLKKFALNVSYDSHKNEVASYLTGAKNQAIQMDALIRKIVARGISLTISPVVCGLTYSHFGELLTHLRGLGVKSVCLSRYADSCGRNDAELNITDEQWDDTIEKCKAYPTMEFTLRNHNVNPISNVALYDNDRVCVNGRYAMVLTHDGKAIICEQVPDPLQYCYGDIREGSLDQIWQSEEKMKILFPPKDRYKGKECFDCKVFNKCKIKMACIKTSLIESGTIYAPCEHMMEACIATRTGVSV